MDKTFESMIVDKEVRDIVTPQGQQQKELVVSYVNKDHQISFLRYPIPDEEMFIWKYTGKNGDGLSRHGADPVWRSYDDKYVRKQYVANISEYRVNELLCGFGPQVDPIYEMNIPDTWFCDIEVDVDDTGFPKPEEARNPINTIAITKFPKTIVFGRKPLADKEIETIQQKIRDYHPLTKDYVFEYREFPDERSMMLAFVAFIKDVTALCGWNFIGYDMFYIYNRCVNKLRIDLSSLSPTGNWKRFRLKNDAKHINVNVPVPYHKIIYDYMIIYALYDQSVKVKENNTLDFVAEAVLGVKKVNHTMGFQEFYKDYYVDYVFYNAVDTILVERIDQKIKTSNVWYSLSSELRTDLTETLSTIKPTETVMGYFLYPEHKVLPAKPNREEQSDYEGAFVWPSRPGVYKNIGGLDFASLYPSIIMQFSISPESYVHGKDLKDPLTGKLYADFASRLAPDECVCSSGAVFKKDKEYLIPKILRIYFAKRKEAKKMKKLAEFEYEELKHVYERRMAGFAKDHD